MKTLVHNLLQHLAKKTLRAYKPTVVGITGSVGKTSVRSAIASGLTTSPLFLLPLPNYNHVLVLPLPLLGEDPPGRSIFGWIGVLWRGWVLSLGMRKDFPPLLILEYGADKKGDIQYLCQIARPDIAVITAVALAHTEYIGTIEDVKEEKGTLVRALPTDGVAILNTDNEYVASMERMAHGAVLTYGLNGGAQVTVSEISVETHHDGDITPGERVARLDCILHAGNERARLTMHNVLGDAHLRSAIAGAAVAVQLGVPLEKVAKNLSNYVPIAGRMRLIAGIKNSLILDDSYNASPDAMEAALDTVGVFPVPSGAQRIAALGDMLELGRYAEESHKAAGAHVARLPIDLLVCVGEHSRDIARGALEAGMDQEKVFTYASSPDAGTFIQKRMKRGDVLLVKGSQGVRMEKIVKELMGQPTKAEKWLNS